MSRLPDLLRVLDHAEESLTQEAWDQDQALAMLQTVSAHTPERLAQALRRAQTQPEDASAAESPALVFTPVAPSSSSNQAAGRTWMTQWEGVPLVLGLTWDERADPASGKVSSWAKRLASLGVSHRHARGLSVSTANDHLLGLVEPAVALPSKAISAAAWMAKAAQDEEAEHIGSPSHWILVEPVSVGRYWLVAIYKGVPLPGSDTVADLATVVEHCQHLLAVERFQVFSPSAEFRSQMTSVHHVHASGLRDLLQGDPNELRVPWHHRRSLRITRLGRWFSWRSR